MTDYIDIVFDGPPSHESGRFIEVENSKGASIKFGEWVHRDDGFWALRIAAPQDDRITELEAEVERLRAGGCARDQKTTQYCAEAAELAKEVERLRAELQKRIDAPADHLAAQKHAEARAQAAEALLDEIVYAGNYLIAEVDECWANERMSIDCKTAAETLYRKLAKRERSK